MDPAVLEGAKLVYSHHPSSLFMCQPFFVLDLKQDFLASLRDDLTFNSRPVIMNLTQIAGENINAASTIAKALEEHIQKVRTCKFMTFQYSVIVSDSVGTANTEIACFISTRLDMQKYWKSVSSYICAKYLQNVY